MADQTPTVGRIVHYRSADYPETYAALITQVFTPHMVNLTVFPPGEFMFKTSVARADEPTPGHWNWPPRV